MSRPEQINPLLQKIRKALSWSSGCSAAQRWWEQLEKLNARRPDLLLQLSRQLVWRKATVEDFFLACCYSKRQGVTQNLMFLDLMRQDQPKVEENLPLKALNLKGYHFEGVIH